MKGIHKEGFMLKYIIDYDMDRYLWQVTFK